VTTPVTTDDLVRGCVKWLSGFADVLAVLGQKPYTHSPYLFQRQLWVNMENSQTTACVISRSGGWAAPNVHNTMRFPRLLVEITVDPLRDEGYNVVDPEEADLRLQNAYTTIDRHLHRPQGGDVFWGTVRTIAVARVAEPVMFAVPDGNGMQRLQVFYAVTEC